MLAQNHRTNLSPIMLTLIIGALLLCIILSIMLVSGTPTFSYIMSLYLIGMSSLLLTNVFLKRGNNQNYYLVRIFWLALVVRLLFAIVFQTWLTYINWKGTGGLYFDDEIGYTVAGVKLSSRFLQGDFSPLQPGERFGNALYNYIIGGLYYIWGPHVLVVRLWTTLLGAALCPILYKLTLILLRDNQLSLYSAKLAAFFPTLILWSVSPLREILITLLTVLTIFFTVWPKNLLVKFPFLMTSIVILTSLRPVVGLSLGLLSVYILLITKSRTLFIRIGITGVLLIVVYVFLSTSAAVTLDLVTGRDNSVVYFISRYGEAATTERFGIDGVLTPLITTDGGIVISALQALRTLLLPSPLTALTNPPAIAWIDFIQGIAWYLTLPFLLLGYPIALRKVSFPENLFLLYPLLNIIYSATPSGATWEPLRARVSVLPLMFVIVVYGWYSYKHSNAHSASKFTVHLSSALILLSMLIYTIGQVMSKSIFSWYTWTIVGFVILLTIIVARLLHSSPVVISTTRHNL